jgi:tRNA dimethylallyltransferase
MGKSPDKRAVLIAGPTAMKRMGKSPDKRAVLIAGPTASGKSALALKLAQERDGVIVNTDALQVYDVLRLLTARPSDAELALAPHRMYGTVSPARRFSTGEWARAAADVIDAESDRTLIFAGGTGLYFDALISGFADVPEVSAEAVTAAEAEVAGLDREARGDLIARRDPLIAERLKSPDPQRVIRALAVLDATGRSLASYQDEAQKGLLDGFAVERLVLNPDRDVLRHRIARRFETMFEQGAIEEVRALLSLGLDPSLPAMKAIGAPEIAAMLSGELSEREAIERAVIATRQYAKRQRTWFRGRMGDWTWIES